jgi:hypothetical protein
MVEQLSDPARRGAPRRRWTAWHVWSLVFLALGLLVAILEALGVFGDLGIVLAIVSFGLSIYLSVAGTTTIVNDVADRLGTEVEGVHRAVETVYQEVRAVREDLGGVREELVGLRRDVRDGLTRLAAILETRLPGPSA